MKIQSTKHYNTKRIIGSKLIEFDAEGRAEVSDEFWEEHGKGLPNIYPDGEIPKPAEKKVRVEETDTPEVIELKRQLEVEKERVANREGKYEAAKTETETWKSKVEELDKENKYLKEKFERLEKEKPEGAVEEEALEVLLKVKKDELIKIALECGILETQLSGKNKTEIAELIIEKQK